MAMAATTGSSSSSASAAAAADKPAPALSPLTVKLDPTKYPLWLAQIIPLLNSRGLMSFVDGTATCPSAFLPDADGKPTNMTNPTYDDWIQKDQSALSLINDSLSRFVVATLEGSISARATWVALEALLLGAEQQRLVPTPMVSVSDHSTAAAAASPVCGFDHVASGGETRGGGGGTTGEGVSGKKGLPGVKFFSPTEEELVGYLTNKIEGKDSEFRDFFIPVIDHVCNREPRDLPAVFFSKPDYKNSKRDRCNRTTDEGFYKSTGNVREIKAEQSQAVIGNKRILPFSEGRGPQAKKTKYVMHEFSLTKTELAKLGVGPNPNQKKEFVLCCLKKKSANSKKLKDVSICGNELAEPAIAGEIASNSEDDQAAATGMIQGPDEHLLKEPSCADLGVPQLAATSATSATSATTPTSAASFGGVGVGSPDGFLWSDFDDLLKEPPCADLGVQQLAATSATTPTAATSFGGFSVGSPDGFSDIDDLLKEPFCADQPHQPPHPPHLHQPPPAPQSHQPPPPPQSQNYCSSTLPSALCTKQGNVPSLYNDDSSKQLSPTGNPPHPHQPPPHLTHISHHPHLSHKITAPPHCRQHYAPSREMFPVSIMMTAVSSYLQLGMTFQLIITMNRLATPLIVFKMGLLMKGFRGLLSARRKSGHSFIHFGHRITHCCHQGTQNWEMLCMPITILTYSGESQSPDNLEFTILFPQFLNNFIGNQDYYPVKKQHTLLSVTLIYRSHGEEFMIAIVE